MPAPDTAPQTHVYHLHRLRRTKSTLDDAIGEELRRPRPDTLHLATLKKRKLVVKDRLARLLRSGQAFARGQVSGRDRTFADGAFAGGAGMDGVRA